ncbi:hypothetical protein CERSUDRAFT_93950 [Gelatoporia subvermispora B]|uniref:Protein OS-9 homolog n=1 Tax=Ceriporiopsis subvermispora (strain B) TaxID=914234 RepID=M2RIY9_CERS8|nr:hypothetical protein CERSUDRAFT_93950 [Gelatoporia subvermispora B]
MRKPSLSLVFLPLASTLLAAARLHHSLVPEDPYAFPKYRVTFLNGLPLSNETAQRWLQEGLRGGELEFTDQPWKDQQVPTPHLKSIGAGQGQQDTVSVPDPNPSFASNYTLERMKLGPGLSYLCLIPPPPEDTPLPADEPEIDITPVHSWSLLQPLAGTCLYHKQAWFTYAYCHNSHVRQFHELPHQHPHRPGEYRPVEDTEWEAYTLGKAPPSLEGGADLTVAEEAAVAANIELARGAGSRYLVQRWGDGTYCDKTGKSREIEVQFHCSMTMTDTILFVKETQTCHYVLHIATPRLCGEPGFKSRGDTREEAYIRCREIVSDAEYAHADRTLPPADHPVKLPKHRKPVIAPPPEEAPQDTKPAKPQSDIIRRALERILGRANLGSDMSGQVFVEQLDDGDGEIMIELVDTEFPLEGDDDEGTDSRASHLADVLRAAGYDIVGQKASQAQEDESEKRKQRRDEL